MSRTFVRECITHPLSDPGSTAEDGCILTTGQNGLDGLDVVVEGRAVEVGDGAELERIANTYESKYGAR